MSLSEPTQSETALTELFEREARQSGQYTHIEPEGDDLGGATGRPGGQVTTQDDERELMVWDVYEGDSISLWDDPVVKESPYGPGVMLSVVDDPENTHWIQSSVAWDLDEMV